MLIKKSKYIILLPLWAILLSTIFFACEEDQTCDEFTESKLRFQLFHNVATDSIQIDRTKFDSVKFFRVDEFSAILTGVQLAKAVIFFNGDSVVSQEDTVDVFKATTDSIRLYTIEDSSARYLVKAETLKNLFIHEDPVDSVLIGGVDLGVTLYNSASDAELFLPINFTGNITKYTFSALGFTDTIQLKYKMDYELLSPTCGFVYNYTIDTQDSVNTYHTTYLIDSIKLLNKYVTPQSTKVHISIYY